MRRRSRDRGGSGGGAGARPAKTLWMAGGIGPGHHLLGRHLGDHDELGPAAPLLQLPHHLDAVLARHKQVHQDKVGVGGQNALQIRGGIGGVAADGAQFILLHDVLQNADDGDVVLDDINSHACPPVTAAKGSKMSNWVRTPGREST